MLLALLASSESGLASAAPSERGGRARRLAQASAVVLGVMAVVSFDLWRCPVAALSGLPCPGCGLTRAAMALVRGDLAGAFALHPLAPVIVPLGLVAAARACVGFVRGRSDWLGVAVGPGVSGAGRQRAAIVLAVLLVGVWGARFLGAFGGPVPLTSHADGASRSVPRQLRSLVQNRTFGQAVARADALGRHGIPDR